MAGRLDVGFGCLRVVALDDGVAPVHHESGFMSGGAEFGEDGDLGGEGQESFLGDPVLGGGVAVLDGDTGAVPFPGEDFGE